MRLANVVCVTNVRAAKLMANDIKRLLGPVSRFLTPTQAREEGWIEGLRTGGRELRRNEEGERKLPRLPRSSPIFWPTSSSAR